MAEKKIQGSITLVTVEDGAAGQNGAPGISMYTYVRYADDINGTNISETPQETSKYIAVLTTTSPTAPSTGYTWSKYVGENGQDGKDGVDGKDGTNGIDGKDGQKGESAYELWLKEGNTGTLEEYLESLKGQDGVDGADGVNGKSAYQLWLDAGNSGTETDYLNSLKGADGQDGKDGEQGPPGEKGEDGTGVTILGSYASEEELKAAHPTGKIGEAYLVEGSLYVWSETENDWTNVGDIKGPQGETGIGVSEIIEQYYLSTSNQNPVGGSWEENQGTWSPGKYIWTRSKIVWTDGKTTYTSSILAESINTANIKANQAATDATAAKNTADSAKDTADAASTTANEAKSEATSATETALKAEGAAADAEATASEAKQESKKAVEDSSNALANATAANNAVQKTVKKVDLEYIVTDSPSEAPTQDDTRWTTEAPTRQEGKYIWSRQKMYFVGDNEAPQYSEAACITGDKGVNAYLHIAYANSDDGSVDFSKDDSKDKLYIGQYADFNSEDSNNPSDYKWTLIKGQDGAKGDKGDKGEDGSDGVGITRIEVKYSASPSSIVPPTDWKESVEQVGIQDGMFFWTRIETFYSDGSSTIADSIAKQGQSGAVDAYLIDSNVEEINRFFNGEGNIYFSPEEINFKTWKDGLLLELEDYSYSLGIIYERETEDPSLDDLNNLFSNIDNSSTQAYIINANGEKENINLLDRILILSNNELSFKLSELLLCYLDSESSYFNDFVSLKQVISQQTSAFIFKVFKNDLDKENDRFASYKVMECKFGTSEEMARFQITATKIQAAVDNARMTFAADGLTITDGRFVIRKTSEENTVQNLLDFSNGNLYINGHGTFSGEIFAESGRFSGEIFAESGSFSGEIKAKTGDIGGFIIAKNGLYSTEGEEYLEARFFGFALGKEKYYQKQEDGSYTLTSDKYLDKTKEYYVKEEEENGQYSLVTMTSFAKDYFYFQKIDENYEPINEEVADLTKEYYYKNSPLMLFGEQGKIVANNIELGTEAKIVDSIILGNDKAFIYNPDLHSGLFLKTQEGKIQLNAEEEVLTLGDITLNGKVSSISGTGFDIRPGFSSFDNIRVSGEIITSIFTKGSTQTVGGAMVFKTAYKIENQKEGEQPQDIVFTLKKDILDIFLSDENGLNTFSSEEDEDARYITLVTKDGSLSNKYFKITKKSIISKNEDDETVDITLAADGNTTYNTLIVLGKNDDIIVGVNSENNDSVLLKPRGLTISQLNITETDLTTDLKVFLGDLTNLGLNLSGYGLYSNNVYLTGSLTTRLNGADGDTYAGINTLNSAPASKFGDDVSNIVFWAGAQGINTTDIQNAKFQVTKNGSIYASQGFFEDSVIARSTITGADIYAARLHGVKLNDDGTPGDGAGALTIYDTSEGIIFKSTSFEGEKETFSIGTEGLKVSNQYFITIDDNKAIFTGIGFFDEVNPKIINFNNENKNIVQLYQENDSFFIEQTDSGSSIGIKNEISFRFGDTDTDPKFVFSNSRFDVNVTNANFSGNIRLGDEESNIEYRKVDNGKGYDLYVF